MNQINLSYAEVRQTNLSHSYLKNANLVGVKCTGSNFSRAELQEADLSKGNFKDANFILAKLDNANLRKSDLSNANFNLASLKGANLERGNLQGANLIGADLEGANLSKANLSGAKTYRWKIKDADFTDTIMPDSRKFTKAEIPSDNQPTKETTNQNMTTRKIIKTDKAPDPVGPYNQAIATTGQMLFVSGQIAIDTRINQIVYTEDVSKQTEQVMANLEAILTEAGATWSNVVKTTVFLKNMDDFATVNNVYGKYFDPENAPARACVEVARLPKDVLVEIDCIAVI
ncbi:Rid family detoxifying hydrolase [Dapis sp. BLCC M126]|uniref:Rid family detoxifying hydrolase n=1 Tax=Dapis sp. BLCC M126 TaxID=3400189 RepID=UPI003CF8FBD3